MPFLERRNRREDTVVLSRRRQTCLRPPRLSTLFYHTTPSRHADQRPRHDLTPPPHIPHHSLTKTATREQKKSRKRNQYQHTPAQMLDTSLRFFGASIRERKGKQYFPSKAFFVINICSAFDCKEEKAAKCDSSRIR